MLSRLILVVSPGSAECSMLLGKLYLLQALTFISDQAFVFFFLFLKCSRTFLFFQWYVFFPLLQKYSTLFEKKKNNLMINFKVNGSTMDWHIRTGRFFFAI